MSARDMDIDADLIGLEVAVDMLLDRHLNGFDRVQADAIVRIADKLGRAASQLRLINPYRPGTLGHAVYVRAQLPGRSGGGR